MLMCTLGFRPYSVKINCIPISIGRFGNAYSVRAIAKLATKVIDCEPHRTYDHVQEPFCLRLGDTGNSCDGWTPHSDFTIRSRVHSTPLPLRFVPIRSRTDRKFVNSRDQRTEKFTYHYVVEESIDCCDAIRLCKEYFEFYKSELSRSLYRHSLNTSMPTDSSPSTQLTNFTISAVGQRLPPYTRSSVATPYGVVSNTDPASTVIGEPNSDDRGKYLDCIRYPQSSAMMSAQAVQYAKVPSVVFDSQSQTQRQLIQGQDGFVQWYPPVLSPQPIPPNPYHVPPSTVFYRPQGCGTVTDLGDTHSIAFQSTRTDPVAHQQARQYLVRSTDGRHGTSRHTVEGDQRDSHLSRYHRRSFPKTKHYLIDEPSTILQNSCRIIDTSTASARTESIRNVVDHRRSRPSRIPQRVGTLPTDECLYARLANMNVSDSQYLPSESRRMDRDTVDYNPSLNDNDLISRQDNYYVRPQKELRTHLCPQGVLTPPRNYRQCDLLQNYEICDDPQSSGQPSYSSSGGYTCGKSGDQNNYDPTTTDPPLSTESRVIQSEPFRYSHSSSQSRTSQARKCSLDTVDTAGGTFESQCCGQTQNQTEESQPPSLLRSSGQTSEICDSLCTSLQQFQLPPSPPHSAEKSGQKVLSSAEKYPESNLPSPPSQSFLNELHRPVKTTVAANNSAQAIHPMKLDCATEEHSTDTGFSSRRDSQRYRANGGRRLPLTPPERMSQQRLQCISPDLITGRRTPQPTIVYSPSPTSELPSIVMFRNNQSVSAVEPDELHNILSPRDQQPFDMFGDTLHDNDGDDHIPKDISSRWTPSQAACEQVTVASSNVRGPFVESSYLVVQMAGLTTTQIMVAVVIIQVVLDKTRSTIDYYPLTGSDKWDSDHWIERMK
ncbi:unnamed protein product [Calicophoron daubneyi]|uniref:Uncharacterized protein n=1 Tax=Calicophoron daubneyi TaxID=300641 RepID=A0AAV2SVZ1_CALDB